MADTFKTIKCPACQKEMVKIFIPSEGVNVDICLNGCGGIYFDNREFSYFDEQHENIEEILETIKDKFFEIVNENFPRSCPVCGAKMVKNFASPKKEVQIDECYKCGGKFLDNGELQKIRAEYKNQEERTDDVIKMIYNTVGTELKALDNDLKKAKANKPILRKVFDKLFGY